MVVKRRRTTSVAWGECSTQVTASGSMILLGRWGCLQNWLRTGAGQERCWSG